METPNRPSLWGAGQQQSTCQHVPVSHLHPFSSHFLFVMWPIAHPHNTSSWKSVLLYFLIHFCHCETFPKAAKSPRSLHSFCSEHTSTLPAAKMTSSSSRTRSHAVRQVINHRQKKACLANICLKRKFWPRGGVP